MHDELLERARALLPALRERAREAGELRRIPDQTIADFREAGFFRMLQPKRWGGLEVEPNTFFDVQMTIASACPSSAWVLGVVAVHSWQLALFAERAQEDVWGADSGTLMTRTSGSLSIESQASAMRAIISGENAFRASGRFRVTVTT